MWGTRLQCMAAGLVSATGFTLLLNDITMDPRINAKAWFFFTGLGAFALVMAASVIGRANQAPRAHAARTMVRWFAVPAWLVSVLGWVLVMGNPGQYANRLSMQKSLRALVAEEHALKSDSGKYSVDTGRVFSLRMPRYGGSIRATLTADGFTAAMSTSSNASTCSVFVGSTALAPAVREGEPACGPNPPHEPWYGLLALTIGAALGVVVIRRARAPG